MLKKSLSDPFLLFLLLSLLFLIFGTVQETTKLYQNLSIVLVQDLPTHIKALIEEEFIEQKIILPGELESITEYTIESVSNNPDSYLITKYTSYQ